MNTNTQALKIAVKINTMRIFDKYITSGEAIALTDELRAEIEKLQTQPQTEGEQIQLFAYFTTIKSLIKADANNDLFNEIANTMLYINQCEENAKSEIIAYIKTH